MDDRLTLYYDELSRTHFWLTSKTEVIERFIRGELARLERPRRILEVGSCAGHFLSRFRPDCDRAFGLDLSHSALARCRGRQPEIPVVRADGCQLPFRGGAFDMVLMQDVLEHIPDDGATLAGINRVLRQDGLIFLCVPAYMALYGHHDKLFGHQRRYTRPQLRQRLEARGFGIIRATYFQSAFLAPLYLKRRFGKKEGDDFVVPPRAVNAFFDWFLKLESIPLKYIDLPFGPTLMCLARKVRDCPGAEAPEAPAVREPEGARVAGERHG